MDKNSDCILKACAIVAGASLLLVCMCLYLGYDCMRKCIEASFWIKIILTVIALLVLFGVIAGIWCCKQNCYFSDYKDFLPTYHSGVMVFRENNTGSIKSCTVAHYDTIGIYADNASDNDIVYVYDSENKIRADILAKLGEKKNIELRFMNSNAKVTIREEKIKKASNKQ